MSDYSLRELRQLHARITKEISRRESDRKAVLLRRLERLARDNGFTLSDLLGIAFEPTLKPVRLKGASGAKPKPAPLPPKYRHPSNSALTWSGRGPQPGWMTTYLANGGTYGALEAAAQSHTLRAKVWKQVGRPVPPSPDEEAATEST